MNNNRFKFRVFDNERGEYIKTDELAVISKDGELFLIGLDFVETDDDAYSTSSVEKPDGCYAIEQCTGLRDRNGKLIYEGGVVFVYNPLTDAQNACVVKWVDNEACYICEYLHPDNVQRGCEFASATGTYLDGSHCEIGGNIHEVKHE